MMISQPVRLLLFGFVLLHLPRFSYCGFQGMATRWSLYSPRRRLRSPPILLRPHVTAPSLSLFAVNGEMTAAAAEESIVVAKTYGNAATTLEDGPTDTTTMKNGKVITTTIGRLTHFTTEPIPVYIEDTDAYGIMYNANYLRAYDRALHSCSVVTTTTKSNDIDDGWSIVAVDKMRYKASPALGSSFVISGRLVSIQGSTETWDMEMKSPDESVIYNTATGVQIALPLKTTTNDQHLWLPPSPPLVPAAHAGGGNAVSYTSHDCFPTYRDEFDPHLTTHMSLSNVLNLMERARSNVLGGPDCLRRLQQDDNILTVITGFRDLALVDYDKALVSPLIPGRSNIRVETVVVTKRRGTMIDCYHTATLDGKNISGRHGMAQGVATLLAIDAITKRPVQQLPDWILQKIRESSEN